MQAQNQVDKNQVMEQIKQKNYIENKKNNSILKSQLKEISSQIEQVLNLQEAKKKEVNFEDSSIKIDIQSYTQFQSVIDKYKKANEAMRKEINLNQYENIINNENGYKRNLQILKKLEKENEYLTKVNKELQEKINETNSGMEANGKQKNRELNNLKKEMKLINDSSKILKQNIKGQYIKIQSLDSEIKKIKSNIDYAKALQEKENNINNGKDNVKENDPNMILFKDLNEEQLLEKIKEYEGSIKKEEIEIKEQEKNYNNSIKKQNKIKSQIDSNIKILNIKIKQMKKGNKIRELKLKEIKKIQDMEQKKRIQIEQEKKKKEEKKRKEILKRKNYLEFQKKIKELGLKGDDDDNPADERNNYYSHTSMENSDNNNYLSQNRIMPGTAKNKNYGNFSSYSNRNAPFSIKFKTNNNNRLYTQGHNDNENEMDNENYEVETENNNGNNNGRVINEIDDLKNDIMDVLNKNDENIDEKIEKINKDKQITNDDDNEYENEDFNDENNDVNDNGNINGNNNADMKISGNRSPFNISPFNNS